MLPEFCQYTNSSPSEKQCPPEVPEFFSAYKKGEGVNSFCDRMLSHYVEPAQQTFIQALRSVSHVYYCVQQPLNSESKPLLVDRAKRMFLPEIAVYAVILSPDDETGTHFLLSPIGQNEMIRQANVARYVLHKEAQKKLKSQSLIGAFEHVDLERGAQTFLELRTLTEQSFYRREFLDTANILEGITPSLGIGISLLEDMLRAHADQYGSISKEPLFERFQKVTDFGR